MKRTKTLAAASAVAVIGVVAGAGPAVALQRNCSTSARMCIHYNSVGNGMNAEFGSDYNVPSFNPSVTGNDIYFKAGVKGSAGAGQWVWNNAASLRNLHPFVRVGVFVDSSYGGAVDIADPGETRNLGVTKNNNASMGWGW